MTDVDLMLRFMLQLLVVVALCRGAGWLGERYLGQTQVVMEMVVGMALGPSLFGALAPSAQAWLFPMTAPGSTMKHPSMSILYVVAQLGLVLYMFLVGAEFDLALLSRRAKGALGVSLAGIALPFLLGGGVALALAGRGDLFSGNVGPWEGALYMGAAMCITAFPMLARIIVERGIANTSMGTLALAAGAADDATAWTMLAVVLASFRHDARFALFAVGGGAIFASITLTAGRALVARLAQGVSKTEDLKTSVFALTMLCLFAGAYITDAIGVYAVFGAFIIGMAMPRGPFVQALKDRLGVTVSTLLLPFFFVYSGLNTKVGLLDTPALWGICALLCFVAVAGKFGGCALAARLAGETPRDAAAIGVLMNARGLMELIILNIGLQQGVIPPTLFTMLTLLAILTTVMASPLFVWLYRREPVSMPAGTRSA